MIKRDIKLCFMTDIDMEHQLVRYEYRNGQQIFIQKYDKSYIKHLVDQVKQAEKIAVYVDFEKGCIVEEKEVRWSSCNNNKDLYNSSDNKMNQLNNLGRSY